MRPGSNDTVSTPLMVTVTYGSVCLLIYKTGKFAPSTRIVVRWKWLPGRQPLAQRPAHWRVNTSDHYLDYPYVVIAVIFSLTRPGHFQARKRRYQGIE